jgi:16S rRNA (cytosine1402-N4)-methyltransferase
MTTTPQTYHQPVMVAEVLEGLQVRAGGTYIDCTLGDGGHANAILKASAPGGRLLGIDADAEACAATNRRLGLFGEAVTIVPSYFDSLHSMAHASGCVPTDGVFFDLGLSSRQLDAEDRGFSFQREGPLDMRFSQNAEVTAEQLVNELDEEELANVIYAYGEERRSRRIAKAIVVSRPVTDAKELAEIVRRSSGYPRGRTHPATRTFQALRIAVNNEIDRLNAGLAQAVDVLGQGGRLVTISYHSLEDREIKRFMGSAPDSLRVVNKKVIRPSKEEVARNRRSRSAKLRVAERT